MTDTDWKPKNPCDGCQYKEPMCTCHTKSHYFGEIEGQKRLLGYQIAHPDKGEWTEKDKQDCIKKLECLS